jgi:hypothetical protein
MIHNTMIVLLDIVHCPVFMWTLLIWAQSRELVPISGHLHKVKVMLRLTASLYWCRVPSGTHRQVLGPV